MGVPTSNKQMKDFKVLNTHKTTEQVIDIQCPDADLREGEWMRPSASGWVRATGTQKDNEGVPTGPVRAFPVYGKRTEHMRQIRAPQIYAIGANFGCVPIFLSGAENMMIETRVYDDAVEYTAGDTVYIGTIPGSSVSGIHKDDTAGVLAGFVMTPPAQTGGMLKVLITF